MNFPSRTEKVPLAQILMCHISKLVHTAQRSYQRKKLDIELSLTEIALWAHCGHQHC